MPNIFSVPCIQKTLFGFVVWCCLFLLPNAAQSATSNSATLQWAANLESDLAGYRLYHGTAPGVYGLSQIVGKTTTYDYTNLELNKTHFFTITAFDASGNESLPSPEVSKYIADSSISDLPPPSSLTISNLAVASGQTYVVPASGLQAGATVYMDRAYMFTTVPASVQGAAYIQTANDDKAATNVAFLSFTVNQPVTVYVAHDVRITPKPAWLGTFSDTGQNLVTSDTTLRLFARNYSAGLVTLGGNTGGFSMYSVIVQPQAGGTPDTTPPTVALSAPANGATVSGTMTISANATDNIGVVGVQFRLNGKTLGAEDTTAPFSLSWDTTGMPPGPYTLNAVARDAAGNTTTSAPIIVTVLDITPPSIAFTSPTNGSTSSGTVNINATATDNIGVVGVQFHLNGKTLGAEDTTAPFSLSWVTTTVSNGSYTLSSTARDAAGNTTTSSPITVTVSNTSSPLPSSLTVSNLAVASGRTYVVPASGLQAGAPVYIDRSYTFTTVPTSVQGATYIQTANADKAATNTTFLRFVVNQPVTVYVAHDVRITSKPSWLTTFTNTGQNLVTSDATLRLFARSFPAGTITLGGNASGGGFSMYAVIIQPSSLTLSNLAVASGQTYVVPASGLQAGAPVYIDRSYTFTTVPTSVQGATYIQTANADKAATNTTFLRFVVNQPVTVYVAHDVRITSKPSWLTTFTNTGQNLVTSDATLRLFCPILPCRDHYSRGQCQRGGDSVCMPSSSNLRGELISSTPSTVNPLGLGKWGNRQWHHNCLRHRHR